MGKKTKFDIHDRHLTAIVYNLIWAIWNKGTNGVYTPIYPTELLDEECIDRRSEYWEEQLKRCKSNCFYDDKQSKKLAKNPISYQEAVEHFLKWLDDNNYSKKEVLVYMWW